MENRTENRTENHLASWIRYLQASGYAPNTVSEYSTYVREFFGFVSSRHDVSSVIDVTPDMAEEWLIAHEDWSVPTKQVHIIAIRAFYLYLVEKKAVAENPCAILRAGKMRKRIDESSDDDKESRIYTSEQLVALIEYDAVRFKSQIPRDRAVVALMAATGMRASEVSWLNVGNITHRVGNTILALRKGQNIRKIAVAEFAFAYIEAYLAQRGEVSDDDPLFVTREGKRMDRKRIYEMLASRQKAMNIRTGTHNIRYTVLNSVERYADAVVARDIASHKSMAVTNGYMTSSAAERSQAVDSLPWAKKLSE